MQVQQAKTFGKGRFQVTRQIGKGGMGVVYEAFDSERNMSIALKTLLHMDPDNLYLFKKEFRALHDLVHPNLCSFIELIEDEGLWLLTMELVHGVDFFSHVRKFEIPAAEPRTGEEGGEGNRAQGGLFYEDRLRRSLAGLCQGLHALHQVGKVHRDVKPSNVLVTAQERVVLLDFGLVADSEAYGYTELQCIAGTAEYMAPEQASSEQVGPAADWYSVGVMLYEALTGTLPFIGKPLEVMQEKLTCEPIRPRDLVEDLPPDLEMLCVELLRKNPEERPPTLEILDLVKVDQPHPVLTSITDVSRHTRSSVFVGRKAELGLLLDSFGTATQGGFESVVIEGVSGIGKSTLVHEFTTLVQENHSDVVFLKGRCYERETAPYKGFDGIIDSIIRHIRTIPSEAALELEPNDADLLLRLFPVLERSDLFARVISSPIEIEDPHELKHRASEALRDMMLKLSRQRPLVIVIDDMQWVDEESKTLLSYLVDENHPNPLGVLLILSARFATESKDSVLDWESIVPRHRLIKLSALAEQDAVECARQVIVKGAIPIEVDPEVIAKEASGHPLYIAELVQHIARGVGEWRRLRLEDVILSRVNALPAMAKHLLETICILGTPFSRENLQNLTYLSSEDFFEVLALLRAMQLIRSTGPGRKHLIEPYHNRVREAVTDYLEETDEAKMMHLDIGRFFLNTYSKDEINKHVFDIVKHLDAGRELISDAAEQWRLSELYCLAGEKAGRLAAYGTELHFYRKSLDLVSEGDWERDYENMFKLYSAAAKCAYINGEFSLTKTLVDHARTRARSTLDKAKIFQTFVLSLAADGKPLEAIDQAILMSRQLGVGLPLRPSKLCVLWNLIATKFLLFRKSKDDLLGLPLMENKAIAAAISILGLIGDIIYYHLPNLWAVAILRTVRLTLKHGIDKGSGTAFTSWGIILAGVLGKFNVGYKWGKVGLELAEKFEDNANKAQTIFIWANFVQHFRDHIRHTLPYILESHQLSHRTGAISYLAYSATNYCYHSLFAGRPLPEVAEDFDYYGKVIENKKQDITYRMNRVFCQLTLNLMGEEKEPAILKGAVYSGREGQHAGREEDARPNLYVHYLCSTILKVYFHRAVDGFGEATQLQEYADAAVATYRLAVMPFYDSLACARYSRHTEKRKLKKIVKRIRANQKTYRKVARSSPDNHAHKFKLVDAELARIRGQRERAELLYGEAIETALKQEFVQDAALACELFAEFYQDVSDREKTRIFAEKALEHYEQWGARAKVDDVKERFLA